MVEFAIVMPVVALLFTASVDLAGAIFAYLRVSQISYEGARYAASLPSMEEGWFDTTTKLAPGDSRHMRVHQRISDLVERAKLKGTARNIRTEYVRSTASPGQSSNKIVRVSVEADYVPIFPTFPAVPMKVTATGPYLYPE